MRTCLSSIGQTGEDEKGEGAGIETGLLKSIILVAACCCTNGGCCQNHTNQAKVISAVWSAMSMAEWCFIIWEAR